MAELFELDATTLRDLIRAREVSPLESTRAVLDRIEELDPVINAFVARDFDRALRAAEEAELAVTRGHTLGPMHGVTFSAKDLIFTEGLRTTGGSELYREFVPDTDDVAVARLKSAGAILLGKTNLAEFGYGGFCANRLHGMTRNPVNLNRTPGGSTGGGAAAVAAGMGPVALGTDGGGSVRIPAAFCGLVGFKPTFGAIPMYPAGRDHQFPGFSGWESVEHLGPITRTVTDIALAFDVLSGASPADRHSRNVAGGDERREGRELRVAWSLDLGYALVDDVVADAFRAAVAVLERSTNWQMVEDGPGFSDPSEAFWPIVAAQSDVAGMLRLAETSQSRFSDYLEGPLSASYSLEELRGAHFTRQRVYEGFRSLFERVDILITPAVAVRTWAATEREPLEINGVQVGAMGWSPFAFPMNLTGMPAISVPCGVLPDGSRTSIQIVARPQDDWNLLYVASAAERALSALVPPLLLDPELSSVGGAPSRHGLRRPLAT